MGEEYEDLHPTIHKDSGYDHVILIQEAKPGTMCVHQVMRGRRNTQIFFMVGENTSSRTIPQITHRSNP